MTFPLMKRMKAQVAMTEILTKEIFEEKIRNASSICIIGHVSPDGDCAGSVLGAYNYIKNMRGDDMDVVPYLEELTEKFSFLSGYDAVRSERDDRRYDLAVVCDCADPDRMGRFLKLFKEAKDSAVIDHHITNQGFGAHSIVEGTASSPASEPAPGGFYVGSGSYGQECPTVFHAKENAEMLVIQDGGRGETKVVFPAADEVKDSTGDTLCRVAVEGTTVKLWSEESAEKQFNRAGVLYHYYSV